MPIVRVGSPFSVSRRPGVAARRGMGQFEAVAAEIQTLEGWFTGSLSQTNNNPGNLKYAGQSGAVGVDSSGFAIFPTLAAGEQALENQISLDASRGLTIAQFAAKYAPAQDSNDPASYAQAIANATGLSVDDPLSDAASSAVASVSLSSGSSTLSSLIDSTTDSSTYNASADPTMMYVGLGLAGLAGLILALNWR